MMYKVKLLLFSFSFSSYIYMCHVFDIIVIRVSVFFQFSLFIYMCL